MPRINGFPRRTVCRGGKRRFLDELYFRARYKSKSDVNRNYRSETNHIVGLFFSVELFRSVSTNVI